MIVPNNARAIAWVREGYKYFLKKRAIPVVGIRYRRDSAKLL
jgi:hypothetical protein